MNKMKLMTAAGAVLMGAAFFSACKKDNNNSGSTLVADDTTYALDNARMEQTFDDLDKITDEATSNGSLSNFKTTNGGGLILSNCATVTRDTVSIPHTVTIDFGNTNCLCNDGRYRRGQILVSYMGHYRDSGYHHQISFNNYYVNNNQVTGTKTLINAGRNAANHLVYHINVNAALIFANNLGSRSWVSNRTRIWVSGENTASRMDDIYEVKGSGTMTRANNTSVMDSIISPLRIALNCQWIEQGTVQITPSNANAAIRTLDYGNGTCDAFATLTVNGNTYNITLP